MADVCVGCNDEGSFTLFIEKPYVMIMQSFALARAFTGVTARLVYILWRSEYIYLYLSVKRPF